MHLLKYNKHWENGFFYPYPKKRFAFEKIINLLEVRQIIAITGLRRTGKSVLLQQLINYLITNQNQDRFNILYFTFDYEKPTIEDLLFEYQKQTKVDLQKNNKKIFIILDEIQKLPNYQEQIKLFYDLNPNLKFIISGSTSLFIKKKNRESLAGRIFEIYLKPLSFKEYLYFEDKLQLLEKPQLYARELEKNFIKFFSKQFIETLSMPEELTNLYVSSILDKIIYEDIPNIYKISYPQILKKLINILGHNPGMLINFNSLSKELGISNKTLSLYFDILEEAFLIKKFKNFSKNLSTSEKKNKKAYLNSVSFTVNINPFVSESLLAENYIATQTEAMFYWRDSYKHEIDFIVSDKIENIKAQEVKFKDKIKKEDFKNLILFAQKYPQVKLELIAKTEESFKYYLKGKEISVRPIYFL